MTNITTTAGALAPAPTGHSRFGASSSERWMECPGSVSMSEGMPNESSEYAKEGTALHAVSSHCLESDQDAAEWIDRAFKYEDHGQPETIEIDEEQAEHVQVYLDVVRADKAARGGKLLIETRFHLHWLHPEFFGTGDCCAIGDDKILRVYDAKFGRGKAVEVVRADGRKNSQLGYYGIGAVEALRRLIEQLQIETVELIVVQPRRHHRDGPVRRVTVTHAELLEMSQELVEAAANAVSDAPRFKAGEWCGFCRGAAKCPTLKAVTYNTAQLDFDDAGVPVRIANLAATMDPAELAKTLDAADMIETWIGAIRAHAQRRADAGETIPGYKLVDKRATRKWRDADAAASDLSLVFGLAESSIYAKKLLSPAQVEKLIPKAERHALADLYDKRSSGTKLARVSDDRPERAAQVQLDFDDGTPPPAEEW